MPSPFSQFWGLRPEVDFLNHGSFGATPTLVLDAQQEWIRSLEQDPIQFLAPERTLLPKLDHVREVIGQLVRAAARDIAFVRNATEGVNAVLRSFPFRHGDEVMVTNHGYNACNNAARYAVERAGGSITVAEFPFPIRSPADVVEAIQAKRSQRTRLILVDHVTSPTGLILPVEEIVTMAHQHGIRVLIDGAHALGMLPIDLERLGADYYTANHHKWLCGPKSSGLLYVRRELQPEVRPTVISHGANTERYGESRFLAEFNWIGTFDPSPLLAVTTAVNFLSKLFEGGLPSLMNANRNLALAGRQLLLEGLEAAEPAPAEMIGSLATIPLPGTEQLTPDAISTWQRELFDHDRIEVPLFHRPQLEACLRISAQAYNSIDQYQRLTDALRKSMPRRT